MHDLAWLRVLLSGNQNLQSSISLRVDSSLSNSLEIINRAHFIIDYIKGLLDPITIDQAKHASRLTPKITEEMIADEDEDTILRQ
jgi:hypothetical protein